MEIVINWGLVNLNKSWSCYCLKIIKIEYFIINIYI